MIITRKWLNKYINFNNISNNDIICALNNLGFEVEHIYNFNCDNNIFCGQVKNITKIPDTNLKFCLININVKKNKKKIYSIICETNNIVKNDYVIIARPRSIIIKWNKSCKIWN